MAADDVVGASDRSLICDGEQYRPRPRMSARSIRKRKQLRRSGLRIRANTDIPTKHLLTLQLRVVEWTAIGDNWMAAQFTPTKGISACPSGMNLSIVSSKT
jgi:hypothetical protein